MIDLDRQVPASKSIQLMATCLCDAFFDDVAKATVQVLEWAGCKVEFPEGQTCCGQPAFNAGDWKASRQVVRHVMDVFQGEKPVVVPSGSCAAMGFHGALLEFEKEPDLPQVKQLASRTWELTDFLVNGLGIEKIPGKVQARVSFHRSCHSRGTCTGPSAVKLLSSIEGIELLPFGEQEQCCGFGGAFSVSFPNISKKMGELKIEHVLADNPDILASVDMGCLLHLGGIIDKAGREIPRKHVAQIIRDALVEAGEIKE